MYGITEVNRENYKNIKWVAAGLSIEYQYQYRGLNFFCDRVHDFGIYIDNYWVYLELPTGPKYIILKNQDGDLPYIHSFDAGDTQKGSNFIGAVERLMNYVDEYYEFIKPYIIESPIIKIRGQTIKLEKMIEIDRLNYKKNKISINIIYQYRGLSFIYYRFCKPYNIVWLELPTGSKYTKSIDDDGDLPYIDMFISPGTSYAHGFIDCVEQLMNYIDTYYEFFKPYTNPI